MGFESADLHIICILCCPGLSNAFCSPFQGGPGPNPLAPVTQTRLWRLGLLKNVPLGYLCDGPLPIHISRGPPPPHQPGLSER